MNENKKDCGSSFSSAGQSTYKSLQKARTAIRSVELEFSRVVTATTTLMERQTKSLNLIQSFREKKPKDAGETK